MRFNDLDIYNRYFHKLILKNIRIEIKKNNFIFSKTVKRFENILAKKVGSKYSLTTGSGTDSLILSLLSLNVSRGDEIIIPSFSWLSVLESVLIVGATPIFVDSDIKSFNLDVIDVKKKITSKTKAVISTSLFGRTCELDLLKKYLPKKIFLIEDGAQNFGSLYRGKNSLNLADISCTSFFPTKNLGSFGDGGAIFTNNKKVIERVYKLRNHGQKKYSIASIDKPGLNSRIGSIQSSILIQKIKKIKYKISKQNKLYKNYQKFFLKNKISGFPLFRNNFEIKDSCSSFNIIVKKRAKLINKFRKEKVPYKIYYPKPLYSQYNLKKKLKLVNTEFLCKSIISLPYNDMSSIRFNLVLNKLQKIINEDRKIFFEKEV